MGFDLEERGLLGSAHYVSKPVYPIENHVCMVNFDMVGDSKNPVNVNNLDSFGRNRKVVEKILREASKKQGLSVQPGGGTGQGNPTDSGSFASRDIPNIWFHTWGILHTPQDTAEKIAYDRMEQIARTAFLTIWELANAEEFPGGSKVRGIGKRLGVRTEELKGDELAKLREKHGLKDDQGALKITSIAKDTVAEKAGLKKEDVIIEFDKNTLPKEKTRNAFQKLVKKAKRGEGIEVVVIRSGKKETLNVIWDKKKKEK
jgi:hypothetical protein